MEARFPRSQILLREIRRRIQANGKITFAEFMEIVLYLPGAGYYTNPDREPWKDYTTSPETHPSFGMLLAKQIVEIDKHLSQPTEFTILEPGAGQGLLAIQILEKIREACPDLFRRLQYRVFEINPYRKRIQQKNLAKYGLISKVQWSEVWETESVAGGIVANELLDSFPVHLVQSVDGELIEIFVIEKDGQLKTQQGDISTPRLSKYFQKFGKATPFNAKIEANLKAQEWISQVAKILTAGYLLIIDYGYRDSELRLKKYSDGTLICYHNHTTNSNPFLRIGYQDITSHINFTALMKQGEQNGLTTLEFNTQKRFLERLGMKSILSGLQEQARTDKSKSSESTAARELVDPKGLGRLKVLLLSKRVAGR